MHLAIDHFITHSVPSLTSGPRDLLVRRRGEARGDDQDGLLRGFVLQKDGNSNLAVDAQRGQLYNL